MFYIIAIPILILIIIVIVCSIRDKISEWRETSYKARKAREHEADTMHFIETQLRNSSAEHKVNSITVAGFEEILSLLKSSDIDTKGSKPVSLFAAVVAFVDVNLHIENFADLSFQSFIRLYISPGAPSDAIDTIRKFFWSELLYYGSELLEDDISSGADLMHFCSAVTKEVLGSPDALFSVEFAHILSLVLNKTAESFPKTED